jgi:4-hydroxybenzoate polyprenyltransferase
MSIAAPPQASVRHYGRVLRHFTVTRGLEVSVLQASPLLGAHLGGGLERDGLARVGLLLLGSTALTAHVFALNDWADRGSWEEMGLLSIALLAAAGACFAAIGTSAILCGVGIAALSLVYSFSPSLGKGSPVAASVNHLTGGGLHFLLGYTMLHPLDARGVSLSLFFGLVFAAGHLNQELRDYETDRAGGIRTTAVVFGRRRGFLASFCLFTTAYALIVVLAALGSVPWILVLSGFAWLVQARWSLHALRRGLDFETALWVQRRYRFLFGLVGLVMLLA